MAYRSAVQSSKSYTSYYLLYGKEMRLPLDIMYRFPGTEQTRTEYVRELQTSLQDAYVTVREKLQLAHQRQKDYYDRPLMRTCQDWRICLALESSHSEGSCSKILRTMDWSVQSTKALSDVTY